MGFFSRFRSKSYSLIYASGSRAGLRRTIQVDQHCQTKNTQVICYKVSDPDAVGWEASTSKISCCCEMSELDMESAAPLADEESVATEDLFAAKLASMKEGKRKFAAPMAQSEQGEGGPMERSEQGEKEGKEEKLSTNFSGGMRRALRLIRGSSRRSPR